jgi:hypothetical protein
MRSLAIRTAPAAALAFLALAAAAFFLPYHFPVTPAVSLSYVTGFNNRAAVVIFCAGSLAFAWLYRDRLGMPEAADGALGPRDLVAALALCLALCLWRKVQLAGSLGSEAEYAVNRIQLYAQGLRPYLDLEFAYGPAHIYLPVAVATLFHLSIVAGYLTWWIAQWLLGVAMLWGAVRLIDLPMPRRRAIFWAILLFNLPAILAQGTAYTPTRSMGAAFVVVVLARMVRSRVRPVATALAAALAVAGGIAISPEQGVALFAGMLLWFLLLGARRPSSFPPAATALFVALSAVVMLAAWHAGVFLTLAAFSQGGLNFPLLPSPTNTIVLAIYTAAACAGLGACLQRDYESPALPLALVGFALMPAAMGRCDLGHLLQASPALMLGLATVDGRPRLRRWMEPLALACILLPSLLVLDYPQIRLLWAHRQPVGADDATAVQPTLRLLRTSSCPFLYRSPVVRPPSDETAASNCLDSGYYYGTTNAPTPEAMSRIVRWLTARPLRPVVVWDRPLAQQFAAPEIILPQLHALEASPWLPKARHRILDGTAIADAIRRDYRPAPEPTGNLRIWYPRHP